jgi:cytochrome b561
MAAHVSHGLLYALMVIVPLAGYVRVRAGGFPIEMLDAIGFPALVPKSEALAATAKSVHYYGGGAIMVVLAAHIGAAVFHGVVKKDGIFSRMWPPAGRGL